MLPAPLLLRIRFFYFLLLFTTFAVFAGDASEEAQAGAVAQKFINAYVKSTVEEGAISGLKWVKKCPVATAEFKRALTKLYADALRKDPELGYGADAVISGQDNPDHFDIKSSKVSGDKAMVVLIGPKDFPMEVKVALVKRDGAWMVDASGDLAH